MRIVSGIFWGVYLVTRGRSAVAALKENHGALATIDVGAISSLLGKSLRV
jgi:hypothetical protein